MSVNLPDLVGKVVIDSTKATENLKGVKAEAAAVSGSMSDAGKAASGLAIGFGVLATAAGVGLGVMKNLAMEFAGAASGLVDLKNQLGIGVVELQRIQFAAKQSGVEFSSVVTGLSMMEKAASKTPEAFSRLGISFEQLRTSKPDELLAIVAERLSAVSDQSERARIAQEIFGRGGSQMLKMLTNDYKGLTEEANRTGLMTEEMAKRGDRLGDAMSKLDDALGKVKINLGAAFANPGIIRAMEGMASAAGLLARNADKIYTAFKMFGGGAGLMLQGFEALGDSGGASASSSSDGGGGVNQYRTGKGYAATTKGLSGLSAAFDKLLARMDRDAAKAAANAEKAAEAYARLVTSMVDGLNDIPRGAADLVERIKKSWKIPMPGPATEVGGQTTVFGNAKDIPLEMPGIAQWLSDPQTANWFNRANQADEAQKKAAESAARWAGALQGVALVAGAIGGRIGDVANVMGNIAKSFEGFSDMDKNGKFNAIAGSVGQIGGLIGGTAGAGIQGAAGGAMAGFSVGGPVGAIVGGGIGLIGGLLGASAAKKKELAGLKTELSGLADEAKKFGINLDAAFASKNSSVVKAAIDSVNTAIKESEKRLAGLSTASHGLNAWAGGGGITDQASSDRAGLYATSIFGNTLKETGDIAGALSAIGPALAEIAKKAQEMGLSLGEGVSNLIGMNNVLSGDQGLSDQVSGLNQMMKGLADANIMNKDLFAALGADASAVFAKLVEGGATGNQALMLMQPTLQQLYEGQKLHGFAVDETTQALIDEAVAQGVVGDQFMSANERIVELLGILIEAVGGTLPASYKRAGDAAEEYGSRAAQAVNGIPSDRTVVLHYRNDGEPPPINSPDPPWPDPPPDPPDGFAGGTSFRNFGSGTRVTLHGEEAVLTRPQVDRLVGMAVGGGGMPTQRGQPVQVSFGDINISANDAQGGRDAAMEFKRMLGDGSILTALQERLGLRR